MPASTLDPIASTLKQTFKRHRLIGTSSLESSLAATAKKSLLNTTVMFDPPVRHVGGSLSALKNRTIILLNPNKKNAGSGSESGCDRKNGETTTNGHSDKNLALATPPKPKIVFFPLESVEVGYKQIRSAGSGMFNMGNTCYLNSTLQALFHTPALFNYLMSGKHQNQCKNQNGYLQTCMICVLTTTLRETLNNKVMRPTKVYEKLKLICKHLTHGRQEDAHEFLRYLIESLQRSFLNSCQAPKSIDNASKETTPFNQIFGGYMRQDVTCFKCKYVSTTFQHFMDLLLDIRQASTIEEALTHYFRAERLGDSGEGNMYKCEKCKVKVPAKKKCFVARPPTVLCIQLKRFSLMGGKINRPVELNRKIDLSQYLKNGPAIPNKTLQYRLVSMITHVGPSPNCGHYTAIGEAVQGQFFQFDDSSVRPIPVNQVLNTASYVVFYEMTKLTKQAWSTPMSSAGDATATSSSSSNMSKPIGNNIAWPKPTSSLSVLKTSANGVSPNKPSNVQNGNALYQATGNKQPGTTNERQNVNKLGVVIPSSLKKQSLVPYGDCDSDSEENDTETNVSNTSRTKANGVTSIKSKSPFVPRAVAMNNKAKLTQEGASNGKNREPGDRPSSVASNVSEGSETKACRSGMWNISESDNHTPSFHSDNSIGSTTNNWKVTGGEQSQQPQQPSIFSSATASRSITTPSTASSSLSSTPEKKKRSSSIEEYEAELDRGRSKKVKKKHIESSFDTNNGGEVEESQHLRNPFQAHQNRKYSYPNGESSTYQRNNSDFRPSSAGRYGSQFNKRNKDNWNHHRDHSYHAGFSRHDNRGGQNGWNNDNRSNYFKRSQSTSSLNGNYRDKHRHNNQHGRFSNGNNKNNSYNNRSFGNFSDKKKGFDRHHRY